MSGETDEDRQRRYDAMVQKINASNSTRTGNGQLPGLAMSSASTYAPSESSVFRLPNTINKHMQWARVESAVNIFTRSFRNSENIDKFFLKLWVRASNEILDMSQQQQHLLRSFDAPAIIDILAENLKIKFYNGRVPTDISSLPQSEMSQFDTFSVRSTSSLNTVLDSGNRPFIGGAHPIPARSINPFVDMERLPASYISQISARNNNPCMMLDRTTTSFQPPTLTQHNNLSSMMQDRTFPHPHQPAQNNTSSLMMQERQDRTSCRPQSAANQSLQRNRTTQPQKKNSGPVLNKTQNVPTVKPADIRRSDRKVKSPNENLIGGQAPHQQCLDTTRNTSVVGSNGVTRSGRQVKAPNEFWRSMESRLNEPSVIDYRTKKQALSSKVSPVQDLNETINLRSKRVFRNTPVSKKKNGSVKNTPISPVQEEEKLESKSRRRGQLKGSATKENKLPEQEAASRSNQEQKKLVKKGVKPKSNAVKKAPTKRKSKEAELTISKRKKVDESLSDSNSCLNYDSDELFEAIFPKKRPQTVNQVLSPSNGLHSVKKAAAAATSKETPPAKFISQLMEPTLSSSTSTVKEPPVSKVSQVVKRVAKMVEKKSQKKAEKKGRPAKDNSKEDPMVDQIYNDIVKSTYTTTTPVGNVGLTVFRGTEPASDLESEMSDEDALLYDDDLLA